MIRLVLAGLLSVVLAAASGAQQASIEILTEDEFLVAIDGAHPAVAVSGQELALARAQVIEASVLDNPSIGVEREDPSGASEQTEIVVAWQLPDRARHSRIEAARAAVQAATDRHEQRLIGLRLEQRRAYADWALAAAQQERLAAQAERVVALADRQAARAERGESSGLEAQRLQLTAQALQARVALAAADRERARAEVIRWLPNLSANARPMMPDLPSALKPAAVDGEGDHPLTRAAAAEVAATRIELEAAGRFVASPELSIGWQRQESAAESMSGPLFSVAWTLPLFDRRQAERAAAEARLVGASARLELTRRQQAAALRAARSSFERLARSLDLSSLGLAASARMLEGAEAAFKLGEASVTDLLDTHRVVTEAALAELDLHAAALAAHRQLERLAAHPAHDHRAVFHPDPENFHPDPEDSP